MTDAHDSFKELYEARHEPENLRPIAEVYWRVVLLSAIVAAIGIILFGAWEFSAVMKTISTSSTGNGAQTTPTIDRTLLESTLSQFWDRQANFELGKAAAPVVSDPSKAN